MCRRRRWCVTLGGRDGLFADLTLRVVMALDREDDEHQRDLTAVDVAEESHRERERLDELEHQLDQPHEERDDPGPDPVPEFVEWEELAQVAAHAEAAEALELEDGERDER